jgi:hypothetical protein
MLEGDGDMFRFHLKDAKSTAHRSVQIFDMKSCGDSIKALNQAQ